MRTVNPPWIAPEAVAACNRLYGGATTFFFFLNGRGWTLDLPGSTPAPLWRVALYFSVGDFSATLFLDGNLAADWEDSGVGAATLAALPPRLAAALLEAHLEALLTALEPALGKPVRLERLELPGQDGTSATADVPGMDGGEAAFCPEGGVPLRATRDDGQIAYGALSAPPALVRLAAEALARWDERAAPPSRLSPALPSFLPLLLPVALGDVRLSSAELGMLGNGDILFPDLPERNGSGALRLHLDLTPRCRAVVVWRETTLTVEGMEMPLVDSRIEDSGTGNTGNSDTAGTMPGAPFRPEDIPVRVCFDLGLLPTTVGELTGLKPGYIFSTGRHTDGPVRITVNGATVGEGALVDVDGILGVRVVSLAWFAGNASSTVSGADASPIGASEEGMRE